MDRRDQRRSREQPEKEISGCGSGANLGVQADVGLPVARVDLHLAEVAYLGLDHHRKRPPKRGVCDTTADGQEAEDDE